MFKLVEIIPILSIRAGAETFFVNLCEQIKKRNDIDLSVVLLYDKIDKTFEKKFKDLDIKPICCHKKRGLDIKASRKFRKIIKSINPDAIHTHNCCLFTYFFAFGFRKQKWNYFHTCHSVPIIDVSRKERIIRRIFIKRNLMYSIAISDAVKNEFERKYNIKNIPAIYNGIPLMNIDKLDEKYDFISIARFYDVKNHIFLIKCFKEFLNFYPNATLVCVGGGEMFQKISDLVTNNKLTKNIFLVGEQDDVYSFLSKSKIFVLPSLNEGNPISILEAMDCGLPVIASNVGGIPDVIKDDINGILIDPNIENTLIEAMKRLFNDNLLYFKISQNNKKSVQKYSIKNCCDEYVELFKSKKEYEEN